MKVSVSIEDVISKVQRQMTDGAAYYRHAKSGTLDQYYDEVLMEVITDVTLIPYERSQRGLDPVQDPTDMINGFSQIIESIAVVFNKTKPDVEGDLIKTMTEYPVEEVKSAQILRHNNMLH